MKRIKGKRQTKVVASAYIILSICWVVNLLQTTSCNFEAPYRCEYIGTIGVIIPPAALVTVFIDRTEK